MVQRQLDLEDSVRDGAVNALVEALLFLLRSLLEVAQLGGLEEELVAEHRGDVVHAQRRIVPGGRGAREEQREHVCPAQPLLLLGERSVAQPKGGQHAPDQHIRQHEAHQEAAEQGQQHAARCGAQWCAAECAVAQLQVSGVPRGRQVRTLSYTSQRIGTWSGKKVSRPRNTL